MKEPARKLKKSPVKNICRFPPIKANGGKNILVESLLESKYCLHLEFDDSVVTYFPQPETFNIEDSSNWRRYTPDFEVHYSSGLRRLVEVKPKRRSESDHNQQLFERFEASLQGTHYVFSVVNESQIEQIPLLTNYERLYRYKKRPTLDMGNLYRCASHINAQLQLRELIVQLEGQASLREIYSWLALKYLHFDIQSEELTMTTQVEFNVD